jgi:hypothetical protein
MTTFFKQTLGDDTRIPFAATLLSIVGLLPFLVLSAFSASSLSDGTTGKLFIGMLVDYGAVILSFLGGIRWGAALTEPNPRAQAFALAMSIIPSLIGWAALLYFVYRAQAVAPLMLLIVGFLTQGVWDLVGARRGALPRWFAQLRAPLTIIVVACLAGAAWAIPQNLR